MQAKNLQKVTQFLEQGLAVAHHSHHQAMLTAQAAAVGWVARPMILMALVEVMIACLWILLPGLSEIHPADWTGMPCWGNEQPFWSCAFGTHAFGGGAHLKLQVWCPVADPAMIVQANEQTIIDDVTDVMAYYRSRLWLHSIELSCDPTFKESEFLDSAKVGCGCGILQFMKLLHPAHFGGIT